MAINCRKWEEYEFSTHIVNCNGDNGRDILGNIYEYREDHKM